MKSSTPTALKLGTQLAAQGITTDAETVATLNALRDPGYRLTRSSTSLAEKVLARETGESSVRVFVALGTEPAQGLAAIQLGLALAVLSRKETLIINASPDHAELDNAFGPPSGEGLAGLLRNSGDSAAAVAATKVPGLAFLPFGDPETHDAATLTTKILAPLLAELQQRYPQVVILSPSLESDEAPALLLCADQVGGIAASGVTTRSDIRDLEQNCASIGKPLLGIILHEA